MLFDDEKLAVGAPLNSRFVGHEHIDILEEAGIKFWLDPALGLERRGGWTDPHVWYVLHMFENGSFDMYDDGLYADMSKAEFLKRMFGKED